MEIIYIAFLSIVIDYIIADPNTKYHPVALMGKLIYAFDKLLNRENISSVNKIYFGFLASVICLLTSYFIGFYLNSFIDLYIKNDFVNILSKAIILAFMISPKSLKKAGLKIYKPLSNDETDKARDNLKYIVSRDTSKMDKQDINRAALETVAENTTDGIIAPLFWFFIGGLPLAICYRMANTMDAMVGYKNEKYLYFGRSAAKIDDLLNLLPARINGILFVICAFFLSKDYKGSFSIMLRDSKKHPSPNGGYPESSLAGALGICLGGLNYYFGSSSFRAYMGDKKREMEPSDIIIAIRFMYLATILFLVFASISYYIVKSF